MILEKTVEFVEQIYKNHEINPPKISQVVIGLGYTGVEISPDNKNPILGLASTLPSIIKSVDCSKIKFAGNLTNKKLLELVEWAYLEPSLEKIIGVAALNAMSQYILRLKNLYSKQSGDPLNFVEINRDTSITVVGLMKPFIRKLMKKTRDITLVEDTLKVPEEFKEFNFRTNIDELEKEELSKDILFCTGTSLINNTLEQILDLFGNRARKTIVMGPSVGMLPDILFDHGVDIVGGMEIVNSEETMKILQEGGGTKLFKKFGKKYNLINL